MLELKNVTKKYGRKIVLDNVSIQFRKGRVSCLLGINGVGKSTTMKAICRLIPIHGGEITVDGARICEKNIDKICFIPDLPIFDLNCRVTENFRIARVLFSNFDEKKAKEISEFFQLDQTKRLKDLSKGNLAKFNLIIGLAQNAEYVLLDEPFSGIDLFTREDFIGAFRSKFMKEGQTIIITTHEIDEIEGIAEDIILLDDGRVIKTFTKEEAQAEGLNIVETMRKVYRGGGK